MRLPALTIQTSPYWHQKDKETEETKENDDPNDGGDIFATYHRPPQGDLDAGHSYLVMLDGHVKKVTVSDQIRGSGLSPTAEPSQYGPGGSNLALAWPIDIPPSGGWDKQ